MSEKDKLKLVEDFIYDANVQNILTEINKNVMDFNILEITGMGSQEIKHSNMLGWLFDDSEHNLEYQILDGFLKKVIALNPNKDLQEYLYLANNKRDIKIYREKDNIDLLIVDESNKIVITIENKVYANERIDGDDGGQLSKYKMNIDEKYYDSEYSKFFIFLTIDLELPSEENLEWLRASHQMVTSVIENILKTKETTVKTKIILESYVDLLKRNGIVADEALKKLCDKIWSNKEYRNALDILIENQSLNLVKISEIIQRRLKSKNTEFELYGDKPNDILIKYDDIDYDSLCFNITFGYDGIFMKIFIDKDDEKFGELYNNLFPNKRKRSHSNVLKNIKKIDWHEYIYNIGIENLEDKISQDLDAIIEKLNETNKTMKLYL